MKINEINIEEFSKDCKTMILSVLRVKYKIANPKISGLIKLHNIYRPPVVFIHNSHVDTEQYKKDVPILSREEVMEKHKIKRDAYRRFNKEFGISGCKKRSPKAILPQKVNEKILQRKALSKTRIAAIIEDNKTMNENEIGKKYGFTRQRTSQILQENGVIPFSVRKYNEKVEKLKALHSEGKYGSEICEIMEIDENSFYRICKKNNLKIPFNNKKWKDELIKCFMFDYRDGKSHKELGKKYNEKTKNVNDLIGRFKKRGF